jgi:CspA family cold shock protein
MDLKSKSGQVLWFNNDRGYGFITDGTHEYFVHYKEIAATGFKSLERASVVRFTSRRTEKGLVAENVVVVQKGRLQ